MSLISQNRLFSIVGLLIGVLGCYFAFNEFDYQDFKIHFSSISQRYVFLSLFILLISVWVRALRWKLILNDSNNIKTFSLFRLQLIGIFGNNIFPMKSGELLRAYMSAEELNKSKGYIFGTIIIERVIDIFFIVALTLFLIISGYSLPLGEIFLFSSIIIIVLVLLWTYRRKKSQPQIIDGMGLFYKSSSKKFIILTTILIWSLIIIDIKLIGIAFGMELSLLNTLVILCAITLGFSIPTPLPGNFGVAHILIATSVIEFTPYKAESIAFAIILHAHGFILFTVLGGLCMLLSSMYKWNK